MYSLRQEVDTVEFCITFYVITLPTRGKMNESYQGAGSIPDSKIPPDQN